jgi:Uma2 family endonuclease
MHRNRRFLKLGLGIMPQMTTAAAPSPPLPAGPAAPELTLADVVERLGNIPPERILAWKMGTATEEDALELHARTDRLFELVDGFLVEKPMGFEESGVAGIIIYLLNAFVVPRKLGIVGAPDGMMRLMPGKLRIPDISFITKARWRSLKESARRVPPIAPDLAIEVLSISNTRAEMARKRREYFGSGSRLVWEVDWRTRTIDAFAHPEKHITLRETDTLDGGDVLPGFSAPIREIFAVLDLLADEAAE